MAKELTCIFTSVPDLEGANVANVANFQSVCLTGRGGGVKQPNSRSLTWMSSQIAVWNGRLVSGLLPGRTWHNSVSKYIKQRQRQSSVKAPKQKKKRSCVCCVQSGEASNRQGEAAWLTSATLTLAWQFFFFNYWSPRREEVSGGIASFTIRMFIIVSSRGDVF